MTPLYVVLPWWTFGFIFFLAAVKSQHGIVTIRDFLAAFPSGAIGPFMLAIWLWVKYEERMEFLDRKLF